MPRLLVQSVEPCKLLRQASDLRRMPPKFAAILLEQRNEHIHQLKLCLMAMARFTRSWRFGSRRGCRGNDAHPMNRFKRRGGDRSRRRRVIQARTEVKPERACLGMPPIALIVEIDLHPRRFGTCRLKQRSESIRLLGVTLPNEGEDGIVASEENADTPNLRQQSELFLNVIGVDLPCDDAQCCAGPIVEDGADDKTLGDALWDELEERGRDLHLSELFRRDELRAKARRKMSKKGSLLRLAQLEQGLFRSNRAPPSINCRALILFTSDEPIREEPF